MMTAVNETDDAIGLLKGEGELKLKISIRHRRECDNCGDPATKKITYCLINGRNNPSSSMYRRDDCTFCEDSKAFSCDKCESDVKRACCPDGMSWTATFTANERFSHMFLYWIDREPTKSELIKFIEGMA